MPTFFLPKIVGMVVIMKNCSLQAKGKRLIDGVERDTQFVDDKMRSVGVRLVCTPRSAALSGVKDDILLELDFDDTTPNRTLNPGNRQ